MSQYQRIIGILMQSTVIYSHWSSEFSLQLIDIQRESLNNLSYISLNNSLTTMQYAMHGSMVMKYSDIPIFWYSYVAYAICYAWGTLIFLYSDIPMSHLNMILCPMWHDIHNIVTWNTILWHENTPTCLQRGKGHQSRHPCPQTWQENYVEIPHCRPRIRKGLGYVDLLLQ